MIQYHCIYCGEQSPPRPVPTDREERAWLQGFLAKHEVCGPKAVGAIFSTEKAAKSEVETVA